MSLTDSHVCSVATGRLMSWIKTWLLSKLHPTVRLQQLFWLSIHALRQALHFSGNNQLKDHPPRILKIQAI